MSALQLRPVQPGDIPAIYRIALATAAAGLDASARHHDTQLVGHVYAGAYVVLDSGFGFVVVDEEGVAGYIVGTADSRRFEADADANWWPKLQRHYRELSDDQQAELTVDDRRLIGQIVSPSVAPAELVTDYSGQLHTNTLPRLRGRGAGRALVDTFLLQCRQQNATGVHLGVDPRNVNAAGFYQHVGFEDLDVADDTARWMGLVFER